MLLGMLHAEFVDEVVLTLYSTLGITHTSILLRIPVQARANTTKLVNLLFVIDIVQDGEILD